jgi:hypothetical protein
VDIHAGSFAFYGQDQWRVTPKLTLTYGPVGRADATGSQ